ncbi:MAG: hypothetical protein COV75_01000 [Candidatus Omnitrophica bacterium CG11_big_fil_rev_8_21_14_0_20_63_9]|nr:MAG: hypothetical protein COV75_01000 [Candidatus Omnitrophica bacterium CG11_big_fil_rev_8_21_14_0_20_63_9]
MDDMSLNGRTELTYLDYDAEAVTFSEKRLKNNRLIGSLRLCCESVLNFARSEDWDDKKYSYDLIYAIGIADYFPDSILGEILARAVSLLENNGQLIIAHKDEKSFCFSALDWFCDWTFYRRDQDHFTQVLDTAISQIGGKISYRVERDETGEFMFFIVTRAK